MKVLTFVVIVSLLWHVWVGMRDIWMDYIKPVGVRLGLAGADDRLAGRLRRLGGAGPLETLMAGGPRSHPPRCRRAASTSSSSAPAAPACRRRCSLARAGLNVAVLSKVFPTRSHTVAAQGGIGASLGNMSEDNWHYHFYDTVKGSDWLGDQDAIEFMCREAPNVVYELEHFGMPFDRNPDGTIYQRPFGGHTANYGEKPVQRACAAADRTGHAMLHTLYQQNVKARTHFFVEWMALDLIRDAEGAVVGVTALEMETGELHILQAKTVMLATGGAGRIFAASTNAFINTGDGLGMAARAGIPLEDMEFWQFHPTGVVGAGVLLTEGCRGEGAILRNSDGERFMERYAPTLKDLAPRDFVSRCMDQEIKEGRGCGPQQGLHRPRHDAPRRATRSDKRLPSVLEIGHNFANVDITREPIPVVPTIHYQMGGVPTNVHGQVVAPKDGEPNAVVDGPLRRRRVLLRQRARRQPARHQLAARPAGLRPGGRQPHRREPARRRRRTRALPAQAADFTQARLARLDATTGGEYCAGRRQRPAQVDAAACRRVPHPGVDGRGRGQGQGDRRARQGDPSRRQVEGLQHRPGRGARGRQPDRVGAGDDGLGGGAARMPRRAHASPTTSGRSTTPSSRTAATTRDWMKHTLWYSEGNRLDVQAGQPEAADGRLGPAQGAHVLTRRTSMTKRSFQIYRYDPENGAAPSMQSHRGRARRQRADAARRADEAEGARPDA